MHCAVLYRKEQVELIQAKNKGKLQSLANNLAELLEEYVELYEQTHLSYSKYTNHMALIRNRILPTYGDIKLTKFSSKQLLRCIAR